MRLTRHQDVTPKEGLMDRTALPVAVIGAGPIGLAAAAHLSERGLPIVVFELGYGVAASVRDWAHVQLFSPWRFNIDPAARRLLEAAGWTRPEPHEHPTGAELTERYLEPLALLPRISANLRTSRLVTSITRLGIDKLATAGRAEAPFVVVTESPYGPERTLASAVIDASGTWTQPNPVGADGSPAVGERRSGGRIEHGIPDVLGRDRSRYAGRAIAVVGSGHSAQNVVRDLAALAAAPPSTSVTWIVRRPDAAQMFRSGRDDQLPERGRLGDDARALVASGAVRLETGFRVDEVDTLDDGVVLLSADGRKLGPFDRLVAATGFRPDLRMLGELRVDVDPALESVRALAPLIDPNVHSCGSVPPHGAAALAHPEPGLYIVGMKSYGRAPTFLLATGYEQVRSVVAELAGDHAAADEVRLVLPGTGACARPASTGRASGDASACCG
jgi:thioredoxin reductase